MDQRFVEISGWYAAAAFWSLLVVAFNWYSAREQKQRWLKRGRSLASLRTHRLRRFLLSVAIGACTLLVFRFILVPIVDGRLR